MEAWGPARYGQPCRDCQFDWWISPTFAVGFVQDSADQVTLHVAGLSGSERRSEGGWSVAEYVSHMADNLRNWAERLQAARIDSVSDVVGYDPDELAHARRYEAIPLGTAMWSFALSADVWGSVMTKAVAEGRLLVHETRGEQRADDIARNNCHDVWHHLWDIDQIAADRWR
jgi:hypothetical protein